MKAFFADDGRCEFVGCCQIGHVRVFEITAEVLEKVGQILSGWSRGADAVGINIIES